MNHRKSYRKLGRRSDHRLAMMKNMTISLINAEQIETTVTRAKELRKFAERMITLGRNIILLKMMLLKHFIYIDKYLLS